MTYDASYTDVQDIGQSKRVVFATLPSLDQAIHACREHAAKHVVFDGFLDECFVAGGNWEGCAVLGSMIRMYEAGA